MKKIVLIFSLTLCAQTFAHIQDDQESDSGIPARAYEKIIDDAKGLAQKYPGFSKLINIGKTVGGENTFGLLIYDKKIGLPEMVIAISGATHGNEYLNIADRLMSSFLDRTHEEFQAYFKRGGAFFVLPILNPDGYKRRQRRNLNNVDLNRDFANVAINLPGFQEIETQNYIKWMRAFLKKSGAKLLLSVDYHCCDGSLLHPWGYTKTKLDPVALQEHVAIAHLMQKQFPKYIFGTTPDILGYSPKGTSRDYWYMEYGAMAFTFEGEYRKEHKKLEAHVGWWKAIVELY